MPKPSAAEPRRVRRWLHLLIPFTFLLAVPTLLLYKIKPVGRMQNWVFDTYQRLRPRPYIEANPHVRFLDIDDETLSRVGQWPWPRIKLAKLVDRLKEFGAGAIVFDVTFPEPDRTSPKQVLPLWSGGGHAKDKDIEELSRKFPDHDAVFAHSIAGAPVVLGWVPTENDNGISPQIKASFVKLGGDPTPLLDQYTGAIVNRPELEKAAPGLGSFSYVPEPDGVIRREALVSRLNKQLVPTLAAEALRVSEKTDTILVKSSEDYGKDVKIHEIRIGSRIIHTDEKGRIWIYYTAEPSPRRTIPVWKVLEKNFDGRELSGAVCFIGTSAPGLKDQRSTPLSPILPGVVTHAQAVEQILLGNFLVRPTWATGAEATWLLLFGAPLILLLERRGAIWGAGLCAGSILATVAFGWWGFTGRHWLLDPLLPSLSLAAIYLSFAITNYVQGEKEKREIRNAFRYYLSPELVDQLATHPENLKLGGEMRRMTFHFCDIEGFTSISEFYDPYGLIQFLNSFLSPLTEVILRHHGTIDKYIGDCIMAFWNAPLDDPRHAQNACLAVLEMHERLRNLNEERRAEAESAGKEFVPIRIRTGLNSGNCIVGNMGSLQRFSYSVIGDDVNLASRLEGVNKFFGTHILASETTVSDADNAVETRYLGSVRVVGKVIPVKVFELLAKKGALSAEWQEALPLYEKALQEFYAREFEQAADTFRSVLDLIPKDGPTSLYLKMANDYRLSPPPESWDGVFHLKEK